MIVLGRKHKFNQDELNKINKKFKSIHIVKYTDRDQNEVLNEIQEIIKQDRFDMLVLNTKATIGDEIIKFITKMQFSGKKFKIITIEDFMEKYLQKCYIPSDHADLQFLAKIHPYNWWQMGLKKAVDIIGVIVLFIATCPVMIYSRYKIKNESPGGSIFRQERVGLNDIEFRCVKFRSMSLDAEKDGIKFANADDDRVFEYGKKMRKMRIDELPQILNVLSGQMHLVGPRPERRFWVEKFEQMIPYYSERHIVRPGITGWAQVMYPYGQNAQDAKQKLMYDLYYIKHWSIWLEIKIVWKTIFAILKKQGV